MAKLFQRRVRVLLAAAIAGFAVWKAVPTTPWLQEIDRVLFRSVSGAFANPPFFISGNGSRTQPWELRTVASSTSSKRTNPPVVLSVSDKSGEYFQSFPLSPVDYAVVLRHLKARGIDHVAFGTVMAWDEKEPDPYQKAPLDLRLSGFDSMVTSTPLKRSGTGEAMPAAFIRSSIDSSRAYGDVKSLPVVNRLPLPGTVLGDLKTLAGFSVLETEPSGSNIPLLAMWNDRIVFALPVVAALAERGLPIEGIELRVGEYLKLSPDGPVIPLDSYGNLATKTRSFDHDTLPVEALLDDESKLPPGTSVIIRDDRSGLDVAQKNFSSTMVDTLEAIRSDAFVSAPKQCPPLPEAAEASLIGGIVFLLAACATSGLFRLRLSFGLVFAGWIIAQLVVTLVADVWLPGIAVVSATLVGFIASWPFGSESPATISPVIGDPTPIPDEPLLAPLPPSPVASESTIPLPAPEPVASESLTSAPALSQPILSTPVLSQPVLSGPVIPEKDQEPAPATLKAAPKTTKNPAAKAAKKAPAKKAAKKAASKIKPADSAASATKAARKAAKNKRPDKNPPSP